MKFIADLHVHSRFSRATAKDLDLEHLYIAARRKGITLVGTGDFTHPGWFAEINEKLVPAEPGLFKLAHAIEAACEKQIPLKDKRPVRFILNGEISSIYKKAGATRKIHNLVFLPDLEASVRFNARLDRIGNIVSDGRPILGLDARDLLEIALESSAEAFLIPAHIWTPWFSLFGSRSGFDALAECFEDLTPHIFAVETGLSSDPPMNWRVEDLDGLTLVSNSDAHSPANLGREANLFNTGLSYPAVKKALETGDPETFRGTIEFFPEEGKYHQDGHRKCAVNLHPREAIRLGDLCPVCGRPLTMGVLHRVEELATWEEGKAPENRHPFHSIIPLAEILSEIEGTGSKSKKVSAACERTIERLGPELPLLHDLPTKNIREAGMPLLAEAIERMRAGRVHITPGYDGEYGRIRVFSPAEIDTLAGQKSLFHLPGKPEPAKIRPSPVSPGSKAPLIEKTKPAPRQGTQKDLFQAPADLLEGLNPDQKRAVTHERGPLLIVAGPGTGKTRTLTHRIAWLIRKKKVPVESILAVTFTNRAAREMSGRLEDLLGSRRPLPLTGTFHAFCLHFLKKNAPDPGFRVINEITRTSLLADALSRVKKAGFHIKQPADRISALISKAKRQLFLPGDDLAAIAEELPAGDLAAVYRTYREMLEAQGAYDFDDLIAETVRILKSDETVQGAWQDKFPFVFVDEYQDLNLPQYWIIRLLVKPGGDLCVIGDPDQSIYGFRGSDVTFFQKFLSDFPDAEQVRLTRNYRSTETILEASCQIIQKYSLNRFDTRLYSGISGTPRITVLEAPTEKAEAVAVGKIIERMIGGTGFDFDDFGKSEGAAPDAQRAFSDFAVLYRTRAQGEIFAGLFDKAGIPFQTASRQSLFDAKGIAELISWLKMIEGYATWSDLELINASLSPPLGRKELDLLKEWGFSAGGLPFRSHFPESAPETPGGRSRPAELASRIAGLADQAAPLTNAQKLAFLADQPELRPFFTTDRRISATLEQVMRMAQHFGNNTCDFLETVTLEDDPDVIDQRTEKVSLLTLHAAKGLEFSIVFIAGCEEGLIPFVRRNDDSSIDLAEERRLFYVGMTRAREALYLCWSQSRMINGRKENRKISPFAADIEAALLSQERRQDFPRKQGPVQMTLFPGAPKK